MLKSLRMLALGAAVSFGAMSAGTIAAAAQMTPAQKAEIEQLVRDYILKNPEIVQDAIVELEKRQRDAEMAARQKALKDLGPELAARGAVAGNPNGDVTLIEFFDYNCGFCKRGLVDLQRLVKEDGKLKIVLKDLPILSQGSKDAAQVAAAVKKQLKPDAFWDYHVKLMSKSGQIGKQQAMDVAKELGLDLAKIEKEMADPAIAAGFEETRKVADTLGLSGTPSYVIADDVVIGAVGYDQLKMRVTSVRKCGKSAC